VSSNGLAVEFGPDLFAPMADSTALLGRPAPLRARLDADGYLLLRGVLDPALVRSVRSDYVALFGGRPASDFPAYGTQGHPAHAFVRSESFGRLAASPALRAVAGDILGGPVEPLTRAILRHFEPGSGRTSRAHSDWTYMDQGAAQVLTMWIPLGDCPVENGGLVYLEDSRGLGADELAGLRAVSDRPEDPRPLSHDLSWVARQTGRRWRYTDFEAGDIAVHTPRLVHAALDTVTDQARVSADLRFMTVGARQDPRWAQPWAADDGN
jgi:hypothetical protein